MIPEYAYVIEVETRSHVKLQYHKISQECYTNYEKAKEFVLNRADKPEQISYFIFKSEQLTYSIREIRIMY